LNIITRGMHSKRLNTTEGFEQQEILERPLKLTVPYFTIIALNEKEKNIVILITTIIVIICISIYYIIYHSFARANCKLSQSK
jgi:hypothetical protein